MRLIPLTRHRDSEHLLLQEAHNHEEQTSQNARWMLLHTYVCTTLVDAFGPLLFNF
jgi:hypothetical protein